MVMTQHPIPATATFLGAAGNRLVADVFGNGGSPVLLLHGGGQTRHAWHKTAQAIARKGHVAYALDQRGHGNSDWVASGAYAFSDFAADVKLVAAELDRRSGVKPIAIGASLGGIAALLAEGESERDKGANVFSALVLVDITPRVDQTGVAKVLGFMRAHSSDGFSSIAEAAQAVADYLPQRPRPKSNEGLKKIFAYRLMAAGVGIGIPNSSMVRAQPEQTARGSKRRWLRPHAASRSPLCLCAAAPRSW